MHSGAAPSLPDFHGDFRILSPIIRIQGIPTANCPLDRDVGVWWQVWIFLHDESDDPSHTKLSELVKDGNRRVAAHGFAVTTGCNTLAPLIGVVRC